MEQVHLGEVVQEQEEVLGWVELEEEEWMAPEWVQDPEENAYAQNAERLFLMKPEHRATL
jgi:hypothetical protein